MSKEVICEKCGATIDCYEHSYGYGFMFLKTQCMDCYIKGIDDRKMREAKKEEMIDKGVPVNGWTKTKIGWW